MRLIYFKSNIHITICVIHTQITSNLLSPVFSLALSHCASPPPLTVANMRKRFSVVGNQMSPEQNQHVRTMHDLKLAFSEFYLGLILLQNYQTLNFTGFRKILKKHDKVTFSSTLQSNDILLYFFEIFEFDINIGYERCIFKYL